MCASTQTAVGTKGMINSTSGEAPRFLYEFVDAGRVIRLQTISHSTLRPVMFEERIDSVILDDAGKAAGITELRRQEVLLKTGALQNAILTSANFSIIATDEKGIIQLFNVGAESLHFWGPTSCRT